MAVKAGPVALTQLVEKAGCASKIGQAELARILSQLPAVEDPNVLLGVAAGDDAGIYRIDERISLVQTVDLFTPCVDDPYLFGQIAAANSLSDIYAMGGRPLTALSIVGFPIDEFDGAILEAILRGGMEKMREAGCSLIGGHSVNDAEIKCGFAVTGLIDAENAVARDAARAGDALVLTKPLGTGMISFAAQIGRVRAECLAEAGASMAVLNKDAAELMVKHGAHACTDITGFGLMGHLVEMARGSGVSVQIDMSALPVFRAAAECLEHEIISGAVERNQEYASAWVETADSDAQRNLPVLYDPQTSGGLLISLPKQAAKALADEMQERGHRGVAIIGRVIEKDSLSSESRIVITNARLENLIGPGGLIALSANGSSASSNASSAQVPAARPGTEPSCCAEGAQGGHSASPGHIEGTDSLDAATLFSDFMKKANGEGLIDKRAKKLMAVALSVAQRCEPCMRIQIEGALAMGLSKAEIDEAAWLGIAFAGAPAMMQFNAVRKGLRF